MPLHKLLRLPPASSRLAVGSVLFAAVSLTQAASIVLHQDAVSAAVAHRLFVDNGKRMLAGSLATCAFAYAEQPTVTFRGGRVFLRMHLSGRAAVSVNGACLGPGDSFNATVSGQPYIEGDRIAVREVRMDEGKKEYRGMVEPLVRSQLPALLGSNLRAEFGRYLDSNIADLRLTLTQFQLQEVVVNDGTLTVRFDFALQGLRR